MRQQAKNFAKRVLGKQQAKPTPEAISTPSWLELLSQKPSISKDGVHRIAMTTSCTDSNYIPKVKHAGSIKRIGEQDYQVMHNGVLVEHEGYFGDWMSDTIKRLKGHHEPQEEKVFHELLKLLPAGATMIELGAYWAYYSIWFNKTVKNAVNYCCEPDPKNIALGKRNAAVNKTKNMNFVEGAAGKDHNKVISFKPQEGDFPPVKVPIKSVDGLVEENSIQQIDILHMDIQGAELVALEGAVEAIKNGKVRFLMISTHHYLMSEDSLMHEKCLARIKELGGHIVVEHAIHESFSGDGLIAASFFKKDKDLQIEVSENRLGGMLFRSYTEDIAILAEAYENLRKSQNFNQT